MAESAVFLCRQDELAEGRSRGFDPWREGRDTVLLVRHHGQVHGWRDACPHHGGTPMAWRKDEYLNHDRDRIVCAAHGAQFDIASGACVLGPCLGQSLVPVPLIVTAHDIHVGAARPLLEIELGGGPKKEHEHPLQEIRCWT